jgi:hypothetical protein
MWKLLRLVGELISAQDVSKRNERKQAIKEGDLMQFFSVYYF